MPERDLHGVGCKKFCKYFRFGSRQNSSNCFKGGEEDGLQDFGDIFLAIFSCIGTRDNLIRL